MTARPGSAAAPYGIVGSGRVARHLGHYLDTLGLEVRRWTRSATTAPELALAGCPVILLWIRDDAIEPFLDRADFSGRTLIHASGSLRTPMAHAMHPLYTFGPELYPDDVYPAIPFVCDEDGPSFSQVFPDLANPSWTIASDQRPLYHAACVMGGNFSTLLWNRAMQIFRELGVPPEAAVPYLERTCANVAQHGPGALTGPLARGDRRTIEANLNALEGDDWGRVYRAIVEAARPGLLDDNPETIE
ncbi:MAG: DUF2520 domain-containing protein [marine benthic group bacterium]|nr:DUF2520 domain-containing protein [Gemmatimonadota bacterium]